MSFKVLLSFQGQIHSTYLLHAAAELPDHNPNPFPMHVFIHH